MDDTHTHTPANSFLTKPLQFAVLCCVLRLIPEEGSVALGTLCFLTEEQIGVLDGFEGRPCGCLRRSQDPPPRPNFEPSLTAAPNHPLLS